MSRSRAIRRYNSTVIILCLLYAAFLMTAIYAFNHQLVSGPLAVVVAILPALPIIGVFAAMGRYLVEETDEYIRMLTARQSFYATGFALSVATIWGFLESFEIVGHVESFYIAVLWFGGLGVGSCINTLTMRRAV
ncbi:MULTISPECIES: hypothetical protein [unclassified Sphingomonas]|uniref:hypothetical protein n=1 Tax=unclassified Sphingomonas TaxID=196159 RepID=UPI0006F83914|nr:hypothetical protein [Sphingomonas sp. Leaf20]KQM73813.1 hypothetical protein ASE72_04325 [Sphingomonas sp. Leaf20]